MQITKDMRHITIIAAMMLAFTVSASAHRNCDGDWKEKIMSERIAFLSVELGLTAEEAQTFWPVYNEVNKEKDAAMHCVFKAYRELNEALKAEKSEKEISALLEKYLTAQELQRKVDGKAAEKYRKVLPEEKVAKLYIGEEKFRRQHIRKMKASDKPAPNPQPGK